MFERLAGKLLHRFLSKYFVQDHENDHHNKAAHVSVWSGYISFENLEFRKEVINEMLRNSGIEFVSGSISSLEITVPWSKLGVSSTDDEAPIIVVVLDGIHILLKTEYVYDDQSIRQSVIASRRTALADSETFGKKQALPLSKLLQKRITDGILKDCLEKLQIHIRGLHVRLEDMMSDSINPYACGITLESLHVQAVEEQYDDVGQLDVIRKEAQLNHFAVYWNAIDFDDGIPIEMSVLHQQNLSCICLASALNKCIPRRGGGVPSASRAGIANYAPKHSYVLRPVHAICRVSLSSNPRDLKERPSFVCSVTVDALSVHLRDFQTAAIASFSSCLKEFRFLKKYRPYRPSQSPLENPRSWWLYAAKVVCIELRESRMRWSWSRFHQRYEMRRRYCRLYERLRLFPSNSSVSRVASSGALESLSVTSSYESFNGVEADGIPFSVDASDHTSFSNPMPQLSSSQEHGCLSQQELDELTEIEDGVRGDLSTRDIILYRAIVNSRLASITGKALIAKNRSRLRKWIRSAATDDAESERECDRLLAYLETASEASEISQEDRGCVAVSIQFQLDRACVALFSALESTSDQKQQYRRLHEQFLDFNFQRFIGEVDLMGNFESYQLTMSLDDFTIAELQSSQKNSVVISRVLPDNFESNHGSDIPSIPLVFVQMMSDPPDNPEYDIGFHALVDAVEVVFKPTHEWVHRIRDLIPSGSEISVSKYWKNVGLAQLGSLASDRASWLGRSARAISQHKNLDLDIRINCPIMRFEGDGDSALILDLGEAHIITESLSGVALGKLTYALKATKQVERNSMASVYQQTSRRQRHQIKSITERMNESEGDSCSLIYPSALESQTVMTFPSNPKLGIDRFLNSVASVYGSEVGRFDVRSIVSDVVADRQGTTQGEHSTFYDKFRLHLSGTRAYLRDRSHESSGEILSDLNVNVLLQSSVIPSDVAHCRFKAQASVNDVMLSMTRSSILEIGTIANAWKRSAIVANNRRPSGGVNSFHGIRSFSLHDQLMNEIKSESKQKDCSSETSSTIDVDEFLDVFEDDGETSWSHDHWALDAESVLNGEELSEKVNRKGRRARSISDLSSISDGSRKRTQKSGATGYLNAENLARLEENGIEEDEESDLDSECDSFHSALSFGGRMELVNTLASNIAKAESDIIVLENKLTVLSSGSHIPIESTENNLRRQERLSLKVALARAKAELRAMKASQHDLEMTVEINTADEGLDGFIHVAKNSNSGAKQSDDMAAAKAKSLIRFRRQRTSVIESLGAEDPPVVPDLNRDIFRGSLHVKSITVKLESSVSLEECTILDLHLSNVAVAFSLRARDSKVFIGTDLLCLAQIVNERRVDLLRAGCPNHASIFDRVVSPEVDNFMRVAVDLSRHGRHGVSLKGRAMLGGIEISPEASLLPVIVRLSQTIKQLNLAQTRDIPMSRPHRLGSLLNHLSSFQVGGGIQVIQDVYVRSSSLRLCIWDDSSKDPLVGALVLTDTGLRMSLDHSPMASRLQLDSILGNVQVFGCLDDPSSLARELFGRKDHFGQVIKSRIRISRTPLTHVDSWVIGVGRSEVQEQKVIPSSALAIDCHVGIRVQPIHLIPDEYCLPRLLSLRRVSLSQPKQVIPSSVAFDVYTDVAIRWRIDAALQKVVIVVNSDKAETSEPSKEADSVIHLMLSLRLCAEHSKSKSDSRPIVRATFHDVIVVRAVDEWPLLERMSLSVSAVVMRPWKQSKSFSLLERVDLPATSLWAESERLLPDLAGPSEALATNDGRQFHVFVSSSPVRLNLSSSILVLLLKIKARYFTLEDHRNEMEKSIAKIESIHQSVKGLAILNALDFEMKLFRESPSASRGGIAFARPLFSVIIEGLRVEISETDKDVGLSMNLYDLLVYDLSMHPGVRVIGLELVKESQNSQIFLTLDVVLLKRKSVPTLDVRLRLGRIQVLPLPSLIDSCLSIFKDVIQMRPSEKLPLSSNRNKASAFAHETTLINLSFDIDSFECILSSRHIFDHVRDRSEEPITVVAFRWSSTLKIIIVLVRTTSSRSTVSSSAFTDEDVSSIQGEGNVVEILKRFANKELDGMLFWKGQDFGLTIPCSAEKGVVSVHLDLQVTDFQALRTCVERTKAYMSAAGDAGDSPAVFAVAPPKAGEQRITNPINFSVEHRVFGTSLSLFPVFTSLDDVELTQAFELKADMIDVLVYIRSSVGGMGDAYRVTMAPIMSSLKDAQRFHQKRSAGPDEPGKSLKALLARSSLVGSASVIGFQVTLVPGGATSLTESPIVQLVMKNAKVGFAAIDIPVLFEPISSPRGTSLLAISGALRGEIKDGSQLGQSLISHATLAGWLNVDVSAHYHNRSLVAWEPLIEQWTARVKCGIDLVRVLGLTPSLRQTSGHGAPKKERAASGMSFVPEPGDRLRDFRKLFSSPFANKQSDQDSEIVRGTSDMPYLLLAALMPRLISSALYPAPLNELDIRHEVNQRNIMQIPGTRRSEWLKQFGHPGVIGGEKRPLPRDPAIQFCLKDTKTLNVNVTGALIENLATYMIGSSSNNAIIPHWIRNETGLTIRFMEVLDSERARRGEHPKPTSLASGREIPLSLKRAVSQSCDPHKAQITLELGSFEETVDRINQSKYNVSKGSRSTTFFYKAVGRIQVDAVGVTELSFYENSELLSQHMDKRTAAVGKIIVRISLKGGIKLVSIESPLILRNTTAHDLHCEVRDRNGIVQHWSSVIPMTREIDDERDRSRATEPIPADLLPWIDSASAILSLSTIPDSKRKGQINPTAPPVRQVDSPPPYARNSISRGLIAEAELSLLASIDEEARFIYLSACSLRLGSFEVVSGTRTRANARKPTASVVPQQRMLLLRPPLMVANHLPVLMHVQVRRRVHPVRISNLSSSNLAGLTSSSGSIITNLVHSSDHHMKTTERQTEDEAWTDLGIVSCGKTVRWTGAQASQEVEIRVKLLDVRDGSSEQFPYWSTSATILPVMTSRRERDTGEPSSRMTLHDELGIPLSLAVHVRAGVGVNENDDFGVEDVRALASLVDQAHRVVSISVPYWIVDGSGLELEFLSDKPIAGQAMRALHMSESRTRKAQSFSCLGLAGIARNDEDAYDRGRQSFEVLMLGHERATRLTLRQRQIRFHSDDRGMSQYTSSWCEPFSLQTPENTFRDIAVLAPSDFSDRLDPSALRFEIVKAPTKCGGLHGTKIVHIFSRYKIINEMGRDIEIIAGQRQDQPLAFEATGCPVPFHFDDSTPIRFRPREFGWLWSGKIVNVRKRREVTIRLVHKLRGQIIIATVECLTSSKAPAIILVFRNASQPPFRLENHTMFAIRYGQSSKFRTGVEDLSWVNNDHSLDSILLPYQHIDFAWDEPDESRRFISMELGETGATGRPSESKVLGSFALEKVAPGTVIRLSSRDIVAEIVADGPTRVLRLVDANVPGDARDDDPIKTITVPRKEGLTALSSIEIRLFHGIGISVVDWTPQELLYISIDDLVIERHVDEAHERFSVALGHLSVDNQLWVTPYPVLLKVGRKYATRRRRTQAVELGWTRAIAKQGDFVLLTNVDLSVDPIVVQVDGAVVNLLLAMIRHPVIDSQFSFPQGDNWLESELRRVLRMDLFSVGKSLPFATSIRRPFADAQINFLATAAVAAKINAGSGLPRLPTFTKFEPKQAVSGQRQNKGKVHINKMRISNVKTELSWSGALPTSFVGLPGILRPALTFEALPVLLRSYNAYHVYGTAEDITETVKHHYISVWRIFDTVFGLAFRPGFLSRAVLYTTTEAIASFLERASHWCSVAEDIWLDNIPHDNSSKSTLTVSQAQKGVFEKAAGMFMVFLRKPALLMASSCRTWGLIFSSFASSLRYGEPSGVLASRTRNPRLFAHVDGKDLLVEYVEGENAGKALLSRVRAGQHLGEGYVFHSENVHLRASKGESQTDQNAAPLMIMVTSERVLLINGERNAKFCHVIWEAMFDNMVSMELDDSDGSFFCLAKIWYLIDSEHSKGNFDERLSRLAAVMVTDADLGLDMLLCKSFYIPQETAKTLQLKITSVHTGSEESLFSPQTIFDLPSFSFLDSVELSTNVSPRKLRYQ